jgi:hypothetical protein
MQYDYQTHATLVLIRFNKAPRQAHITPGLNLHWSSRAIYPLGLGNDLAICISFRKPQIVALDRKRKPWLGGKSRAGGQIATTARVLPAGWTCLSLSIPRTPRQQSLTLLNKAVPRDEVALNCFEEDGKLGYSQLAINLGRGRRLRVQKTDRQSIEKTEAKIASHGNPSIHSSSHPRPPVKSLHRHPPLVPPNRAHTASRKEPSQARSCLLACLID